LRYKNRKFFGGEGHRPRAGAQPPPKPLPQWGGGHSLPHPSFFGAIGASILAPPWKPGIPSLAMVLGKYELKR